MSNISDRQTFVISVNLEPLDESAVPPLFSIVNLPMNLRFAADELIVKSISYSNPNEHTHPDVPDVIQVWCNITNDNIIGSFPNSGSTTIPVFCSLNNHCRISNSFQMGNFVLQFQVTDGSPTFANVASYNSQSLISSQSLALPMGTGAQRSFGVAVLTIEFVKLKNKEVY